MYDNYPVTSRYHGSEIAELETADGRTLLYLRRRFIPGPERFSTLKSHRVAEADRLDNLAAHYHNDAEQFWRICDPNVALQPEELTERPGRVLRITLPADVPGTDNAQG